MFETCLSQVCLYSGDEKIGQNIFNNLEKLYDTTIYSVDFTQNDLMWMSAMWANIVVTASTAEAEKNAVQSRTSTVYHLNQQLREDEERERDVKMSENDVVKFRFQLPSSMGDCGIKNVDIKLNGAQVRKIWNE